MADALKSLYVRVKPKAPVNEFHRCGFKFSLLWVLLAQLDAATFERLQNEQMLETSEDEPEDYQAAVEAEPAVENNADEVAAGLQILLDAEKAKNAELTDALRVQKSLTEAANQNLADVSAERDAIKGELETVKAELEALKAKPAEVAAASPAPAKKPTAKQAK